MLRKYSSLITSERVWNYVDDMLEDTDMPMVQGWLDTFRDGREAGLYCRFVTCHPKLIDKKDLYVWVYEDKNGDDVVVVNQKEAPVNAKPNDDAYYFKKTFAYCEERKAAEYIVTMVKNYFKLPETVDKPDVSVV